MQTGRIYKPDKFGSYFLVPRVIFRDNKLSLGAVGLFCFLLSHDKNFQMTVQFCINSFKDGKDAVRARFKELTEAGYLDKIQVRDEKTKKFLGYDFVMTLPHGGKPVDGKPVDGKSATKNNNNNNIVKTYKDIYLQCFDNLELLFPEDYRPKNKTQKNNWLDAIAELDTKHNINPRQVFYISKKTLEDDFWAYNYRSPLKLLRKNKDGIMWVIVFKERFAKDMQV